MGYWDDMTAFRWTCRTTLDPVISAPRSRVIVGALYREAKRIGAEDVFLEEWRAKRADWVRGEILTQRKWQQHTRRPSRARHHDSIAIREKYVRSAR